MIYIDLDETLISQDLYIDEAHSTRLRPGVLDFLGDLRMVFRLLNCPQTHPVHLLSAGMNAYVRQNNTIHKLGFPDENIVGRESLYTAAFDDQYRDIVVPIKKDVCPHAVLIENQPILNEYTRVKMEYLGIKDHQVIIVPHFYYHPDRTDDYFIEHRAEMLNKIISILGKSLNKDE